MEVAEKRTVLGLNHKVEPLLVIGAKKDSPFGVVAVEQCHNLEPSRQLSVHLDYVVLIELVGKTCLDFGLVSDTLMD